MPFAVSFEFNFQSTIISSHLLTAPLFLTLGLEVIVIFTKRGAVALVPTFRVLTGSVTAIGATPVVGSVGAIPLSE